MPAPPEQEPEPEEDLPESGAQKAGTEEGETEERETAGAFDGFAQALHDAQVDVSTRDDSALLPEDAHDPQALCAFLDLAD